MTKAEIFIQTISEVSGRSKDEISKMLEPIRQAAPGGWDKEVPAAEAEKLLNSFRAEAPGILAWLVRGGMEFRQEQDAARKNGKIH
ncbi:hypothetical protein [uncultured Desulfuromusa sp.]|uniref:hypothetical protein n=1 Tax=uncultured Desulfuromusa sp. TaxID=219183 RepID=UPI002AA6FA24|nr:hypothetical protein [uncultured Desulfuromusa sp.]